MTGTVLVAKGKSFDVRTVDFERVAQALRIRAESSEVVKKLLRMTDQFGVDMICADELNSAEFRDFYRLLGEIRAELSDTPGLVAFIDQIFQWAQSDARLRD